MTRYMVLKRNGKSWDPVATVESRGDKAAIEKAIEKDLEKPKTTEQPETTETPEPQAGGEFVAVPVRNWHPRNVGVDTKTTITIT